MVVKSSSKDLKPDCFIDFPFRTSSEISCNFFVLKLVGLIVVFMKYFGVYIDTYFKNIFGDVLF